MTDELAGRRTHRLRWIGLGAAFLVVAVISSAGGAAWAAARFSDVPESHAFYSDIEWMAATGISEGYEDGTYKPVNAVSRQAMSAFMRRLAASFERVEQTFELGMDDLVDFPPEGPGQVKPPFTLAATCPDGGRLLAGGGEPHDELWAEHSVDETSSKVLVDASKIAHLPFEGTLDVSIWALCGPPL